jgi:hypothetical protein
MFLLRLRVYIPSYSDGRKEVIQILFFVIFPPLFHLGLFNKIIPRDENSSSPKENQQIDRREMIRTTNRQSRVRRIQHCQVHRRQSSLHPLQIHFHHSLD